MSESQSGGLKRLSQADIRKLEKMAQKAKRDEEARSAKTGPPNYAAVPNSVSFDAPIRGSTEDPESRRLSSVLGRYEDMSPIFTSGRTGNLMGVERQPATPAAKLTNNVFNEGFNKSNRHSKDGAGRNSHGGGGQASRQIDKAKLNSAEKAKLSTIEKAKLSSVEKAKLSTIEKAKLSSKAKLSALAAESSSSSQSKSSKESMKPPSTSADNVKNKGVSNRAENVTSNSQRSDHKSSDHPRGDSASSKGYNKPASSGSSSNKLSAQPAAKTTTTTDHHHADQKHSSSKNQPHSREPVLQELGKELTKSSKPNSKHVSSKHQSSRTSDSVVAEGNKESAKEQTQKSVLQVKEENRNDPVVNGRNRHRPRIQLPEKNVEDMLKELTHVPQPLTAIQTPLKDIKSPFNDHTRVEVKKPSHKESRPAAPKAPSVAIPNKTVPTEPPRERVVEEIQEKDDTSDSDSDNDDDADSSDISLSDDSDHEVDVEVVKDEGEEEEEGEIKSDEEEEEDVVVEKSSVRSSHHSGDSGGHGGREKQGARSRTKEKSVSVEPVTQQPVPTPGPVSAPGVPAMPVKGQRERMSSSESSGSDSDSSEDGSGSDSDSDLDQDASAGAPPTATQQSGSGGTGTATATTPKGNMSPNSMEPSPSKQRWSLKSYFQPEPQLININQKPASCEAPASNKSDPDHFDEITDVKRSDNVSDENIPSVGHDSVNKPMSADEFSPPAPVDKCVLSPIKSPPPVLSPAKRRPSAIDRSPAAKGNESRSPYQNKPYDNKHKDRKATPVRPSPEVVETGSKRGRKPKTKTPYFVESSSCESESEGEGNSSFTSDSFKKSLPVSPQKSQKTVKLKRDKLIKEKDSVKLKKRSAAAPSKSSHCDRTVYNSVAPAVSKPQESIEKMLDSFPKETPLSPIPNVPKVSRSQKADLRKAGLEVAPVKPALLPLNGLVSYVDGKPSVLVKLDLSLLQKLLPLDMLKTRPHKHKGSSTPLQEETSKVQKLNPVKDAMPNVISPQKVLENTSHAPTGSVESNSRHSKHGSAKDRSTHSTAGHSRSKSHQSDSVHVYDKSDSGVPDFDSLPVREVPSHAQSHLSEESSAESSSSDSDIDDDSMTVQASHSRLSAPVDNKKRKVDDLRVDDSKRRKTSSKSPHKAPVQESRKKYSEDTGWEERPEVVAAPTHSKRKSGGSGTGGSKRERHGSASSQLSTHSQHSQQSQHSQHSSHGGRDGGGDGGSNRGHGSSHHKARRTGGTPAQEAPTAAMAAHNLKSPAHDLKSQPAAAAASAANTAVKNPIKSEPAEPVKENGYSSQSAAPPPCPDSTTGLKRTHEIFYSADHYHRYAKSFKYQADAMEAGLSKYKLYLESVLYFTQCGYALEKEHMVVEAASMYKDTQKLVIHQFHQFRGHQEPESPEHKLSVLCLRIQSLVYLKLYQLKKKETLKLKKILEDHNNKSAMTASQQPKPPSAPSPLQTNWNRSTGTPSPMSPTPSPASVGSVGSVGSDHATPSKMSNGSSSGTSSNNSGTGSGAAMVPSGSVMIPQRIHTVTQKYFANTNYMVQAYEQWEQADAAISPEIKDFFAALDMECGPLTFHSSLMHLVKYVTTAIDHLELK